MTNQENLPSLREANKAIGQAVRPLGITVVAILMILFGLAEVATGFTHNFLGLISTAEATASTYGAAIIGSLYALGGVFLLTMKKWAAMFAEISLTVVVLGRITLVVAGLYPINSFLQTFSIIVGTAIAIFFAIYIALKWKLFR
jgi:hypothetical protein